MASFNSMIDYAFHWRKQTCPILSTCMSGEIEYASPPQASAAQKRKESQRHLLKSCYANPGKN